VTLTCRRMEVHLPDGRAEMVMIPPHVKPGQLIEVCICMRVYMFVCVYVCVSIYMCVCMFVYVWMPRYFINVSVYVFMYLVCDMWSGVWMGGWVSELVSMGGCVSVSVGVGVFVVVCEHMCMSVRVRK